jgi:hypothetical protein
LTGVLSRNCKLDREIVIGGGFTAMLKPCYTRGVLAKNVHTAAIASLGAVMDAELKL